MSWFIWTLPLRTRDVRPFTELVKKVAAQVSIPFTVGGGINEMKDVDRLLSAGADKVSINSAAIRNPNLIEEIAKNFGCQVCVVAIDANFEPDMWRCYLNGGRVPTDRELFSWAKEAQERGAGEILFTSMTHDGVKDGYANDALNRLSQDLNIPVIASGGAGKREHFRDAFLQGHADAALAASVFHFRRNRYTRFENIPCHRGRMCKIVSKKEMKIDFEKMGGLVPAIIQDSRTSKVLMLGFMNEPAWEKTQETGKVTFFSRTKNRLVDQGRDQWKLFIRRVGKSRLRQRYASDRSSPGRSGFAIPVVTPVLMK